MRKTKTAGSSLPALNPLDQDPEIVAARAEIDGLQERIRQADDRRSSAIARTKGAKPKRSIADRARDLVAGGKIPAADPQAEIQAANEEADVLSPALAEARQRLAEVMGRKSVEVGSSLRGEYGTRLRRVQAAMTALSDTISDVTALRDSVTSAGYALPSHSWPLAIPPAAWALGSANQFSSQAAQYARALDQQGF